jgi:plasmid maintenance system antidote protein VapI
VKHDRFFSQSLRIQHAFGLLQISPAALRILDEKKPVSPNVAAGIGKLIGNAPAIWLRPQAA